jgi:hypothetical protein
VFWYIDDVDREGNEQVNSHTYFGDRRKFEGAEHAMDLIFTLILGKDIFFSTTKKNEVENKLKIFRSRGFTPYAPRLSTS